MIVFHDKRFINNLIKVFVSDNEVNNDMTLFSLGSRITGIYELIHLQAFRWYGISGIME